MTIRECLGEYRKKQVSNRTLEITDKEALTNLKENGIFIINIPGMHPSEFLKILKKYGIDYSRVGFKRYFLSPSTGEEINKSIKRYSLSPSTGEEINKSIVAFRLFCLISAIILLFSFIHGTLSLLNIKYNCFLSFWICLESYSPQRPLITGFFFLVLGTLGIILWKKGREWASNLKEISLTLLKSYMGVDHNGRSRRKN